MIIHYCALLNILDNLEKEILSLYFEINNTVNPNPFDYVDKLNHIDFLVNKYIKNEPIYSIAKKNHLLSHLHYAQHFSIKTNGMDYIISNLYDVINSDIPDIRKHIIEYFNLSIDEELLQETKNLLQNSETTSAVRASFILLSNRLRKAFDIPNSVNDGVILIDTVFKDGRQVKYRTGNELSDKEKRNFKNFISGTYALHRNDAAHEGDISIEAANAALSTINYVLRTLEI